MNNTEKLAELRKRLEELKNKEKNLNDILLAASREGSIGTHHKVFWEDLNKVIHEEKQLQQQIDDISTAKSVK